MAAVAGVPHVAWQESDDTNTEIRVARLNATGTAWEKVADSSSPINESATQNAVSPSLADIGGVPHVAWTEDAGNGIGGPGGTLQIRVARLNSASTEWEKVGQTLEPTNPINTSPGRNGTAPSLASVNGVPHVAWQEFDTTDSNFEIRVARLNDTATGWDEVAGGASPINASPTARAEAPSLTAIAGVPYVAWQESDGTNSEIRIARLNEAGDAWEKVAGGDSPINVSPTQDATEPSLAAVGTVPFVAWAEDDDPGAGVQREIRVARLNETGDAWEKVADSASPINESSTQNADRPGLAAVAGVPYVVWREPDGTNEEIRVAALNESETAWEKVAGGPSPVNHSATAHTDQPSIANVGDIPWVGWTEQDGPTFEVRVSRLEPEFLSRSADPTSSGATLRARIRSYDLPYPVGFLYGESLESETPTVSAPSGVGDEVTVSRQVGGLTPQTLYAFRPFATAGVPESRVLGSVGAFATTAGPAGTPPADDPPQPLDDPPPPATPPPEGSPDNRIELLDAKRNARRGTAKLPVEAPGPGTLELAGKGVKAASKDVAREGTVNLRVAPKPKLERKLDEKGRARVTLGVTFTPTGGAPNTERTTVKLRRVPHRSQRTTTRER